MMRRILLVNVVPLAMLVGTLLYLNQFQNSLLEAEVSALREQARIYAGRAWAVGGHGGAAPAAPAAAGAGQAPADGDAFVLDEQLARPLLLRLTEPSPSAQARLFAPDGQQIADSRADFQAGAHAGREAVQGLPDRAFGGMLAQVYDRLLSLLPQRTPVVPARWRRAPTRTRSPRCASSCASATRTAPRPRPSSAAPPTTGCW